MINIHVYSVLTVIRRGKVVLGVVVVVIAHVVVIGSWVEVGVEGC